jgi:hypothetical protein
MKYTRRLQEYLAHYEESCSGKKEAIMKAITVHFKLAVAEAAGGGKGVWLLAKWAKTSGHFPPTPPSNSNNFIPSSNAMTLLEKVEALKVLLFPSMPDADFSDIPNATYLAELL